MDLGLTGKVALVAAASKGLGFGVAKALAQTGAKVSICSRSSDDIEAAAKKLADEYGTETLATACDVTNKADIDNWINRTLTQWGSFPGKSAGLL